MKLYPFQQAGVQFMLNAPTALLGDEMGSGLARQSRFCRLSVPMIVSATSLTLH